MAEPAKKRATYDDLFGIPAHRVGEIVYGVLYAHPRPAGAHAQASSALGGELERPFKRGKGGPGGWIILDEPELHLGPEPDILVPDLAGWRVERMPTIGSQTSFALAPDWVCEVLSPSTQKIDRSDKMDVYAREGVRHLWFIEPLAKLLETYRLEDSHWTRVGTWRDEAVVRVEPFEAIELELAALWIKE